MNEYQPTGLKAFGWGFLGFMGSNFWINLVFTVGVAMIESTGNVTAGLLLLAATMYAAFGGAWWFRKTRRYRATATGVTVSMTLQMMFFFVGFFEELGNNVSVFA